ncbi:hypothetical protein FGO68_gene13109 [Halteria grandinella]|uniref:MIF4G domain-containing protein n=1 Tax=Halteria grandinella TaxID=5974 RepID=A0A8J8P3P0_HALGN|nr:hypothetical protein FGO68_gene13109 [Halteria grandinella]
MRLDRYEWQIEIFVRYIQGGTLCQFVIKQQMQQQTFNPQPQPNAAMKVDSAAFVPSYKKAEGGAQPQPAAPFQAAPAWQPHAQAYTPQFTAQTPISAPQSSLAPSHSVQTPAQQALIPQEQSAQYTGTIGKTNSYEPSQGHQSQMNYYQPRPANFNNQPFPGGPPRPYNNYNNGGASFPPQGNQMYQPKTFPPPVGPLMGVYSMQAQGQNFQGAAFPQPGIPQQQFVPFYQPVNQPIPHVAQAAPFVPTTPVAAETKVAPVEIPSGQTPLVFGGPFPKTTTFTVANQVIQQNQSTVNPSAPAFQPTGVTTFNANSAAGFNPGATPFKPPVKRAAPVEVPVVVEAPPAPPVEPPKPAEDPFVLKMKEQNINEEDQPKLKEALESLRKGDAPKLQIFKELKSLLICKTTKPAESVYWPQQENRFNEHASMEKKSFIRGNQRPDYNNHHNNAGGHQHRGRGRGQNYNQPPEDNMKIGGFKPDPQQSNPLTRIPSILTEEERFVRQVANELKQKLSEEAKKFIDKTKLDKNLEQKIRLIVNVITPDNFDKKFEELREYMFGKVKLSDEPGYNAEVDKWNADDYVENMIVVVERIFKKAQNEREYCIFYGDLCEKIIRLELQLQGLKPTVKNIKNSKFRANLLTNCRSSFDQFFTPEVKKIIEKNDNEELLKFQHRLYGNIAFVGELNRRGLIQESIILSVFDMLLAIETNGQLDFVNDMTVEGAVILIEKIGITLDAQILKLQNAIQQKGDSDKPSRDSDTLAKINNLFKRFEDLTTSTSNPQLSNRIKLLIKNMLDNRASGWERTKKRQRQRRPRRPQTRGRQKGLQQPRSLRKVPAQGSGEAQRWRQGPVQQERRVQQAAYQSQNSTLWWSWNGSQVFNCNNGEWSNGKARHSKLHCLCQLQEL